MKTISGEDINTIYRDLCRWLIHDPENRIAPRGMLVHEITNFVIESYNPRIRILNFESRQADLKYLVGEICFYLRGSNSLNEIAHYSSFWRKVSDDGIIVNSAYGKRMFWETPQGVFQNQFDYVVDVLSQDKDSRKAVITIYDASDSKPSHDNPCTMDLVFQIRKNKLNMTVHIRSNDIWFGLTYDFPFFALTQEIVLVALQEQYPELELGTYTHWANSMHLYEKDFAKAQAIAEGPVNTDESSMMPEVCSTDVKMWFASLLEYEVDKRNRKKTNNMILSTSFQDWCKDKL